MLETDNVSFYIIIPVYNMERYLSRCVESIIHQSYRNWRMVLVNDGSVDRSGDIIDNFAASDSRISAIHKTNGGIASAMKAALANIDGDFVVFIDSDDYVEDGMLSILAEIIRVENTDAVQFGMRKVDEKGAVIGYEKSENETIVGAENILRAYFDKIRMPSVAMRTFRKELFINVEIIGNNIGVDETTIIQLLGNCEKLVCIDVPLYNIFVRGGSVSRSTITMDFVNQCFNQYEFMYNYIHNNFMELQGFIQLKYLKLLIFIGNEIKEHSLEEQIDLKSINDKFKGIFHILRKNKVFLNEPLKFRIGSYVFRISPKIYHLLKTRR